MSWPEYYNPFSNRYSFGRELPNRDVLSQADAVELLELLRQYPLPINCRVPRSRPGREVRAAQLLALAIRIGLLTDEIPPQITDQGRQWSGAYRSTVQ
jgi:hypothetical protein